MDWLTLLGNGTVAAVAGGIVSLVVSHFQGIATARREIRRRQAGLSFEISRMLVDAQSAPDAARRFAVAIVKVIADPTGNEKGKVCFIPINSRVTIGRDLSNDIVLSGAFVSRFHCGIYCDISTVYLEDYRSTNRTLLNRAEVELGLSRSLKNGDRIEIGDYVLEFQFIHRPRAVMA